MCIYKKENGKTIYVYGVCTDKVLESTVEDNIIHNFIFNVKHIGFQNAEEYLIYLMQYEGYEWLMDIQKAI